MIWEAVRFNVLACGRRWGKTLLGTNRIITDNKTAVLEGPVGWFSPSYKMLLEVWRDLVHILQPITKRKSVQERRLELVTGGTIEMWSLDNPDAARGRAYRRIIVDEAAMVPGLFDAWQKVLRPTLADYAGDAWFLSTPKGFNGFKVLYDYGQDPGQPDWRSWQIPTSENPHIDPAEIEAMRLSMPEQIFNQEVLARFIDDAGGVFRRVMEAVTVQPVEARVNGSDYIFGVDWGKHNDFTVITVLDANTRQLVQMDRFNQIDYTLQRARLMALAEKFRPSQIIAESNSMGDPVIDELVNDGLPMTPFTTTNASKKQAIEALALAFERGDIGIISDDVLISELQAYEAERLPSGLLRYNAPSGMHDDCVMSLAMAWQGVAEPIWLLA